MSTQQQLATVAAVALALNTRILKKK